MEVCHPRCNWLLKPRLCLYGMHYKHIWNSSENVFVSSLQVQMAFVGKEHQENCECRHCNAYKFQTGNREGQSQCRKFIMKESSGCGGMITIVWKQCTTIYSVLWKIKVSSFHVTSRICFVYIKVFLPRINRSIHLFCAAWNNIKCEQQEINLQINFMYRYAVIIWIPMDSCERWIPWHDRIGV